MKSIFDLKTQNKDLSSANQGLSNYHYQEIQPLRSVLSNNFYNGEMVFRWTYGSNKFWIPNKSYFRIRLKLTDSAGVLLTANSDIVLAMNTAPCLFQTISYKISDQTVCAITENLAQIDSLKNRMNKSGNWLNTIGHSLNNWGASYECRENKSFTLGGSNIPNDHVIATWSSISSTCVIADDDKYTMTVSGDKLTITFTDTSNAPGSVLSLTNSRYLIPGNIIHVKYRHDLGAVGNAPTCISNIKGYITAVTTLSITFISYGLPLLIPALSITLSNDPNFSMSVSRNSLYGDSTGLYTTETDLIWTPSLSIFDCVKHAIPCASTKQEITLTPYNEPQWQINVVESTSADKIPNTNFKVEITDLRLYLLTCDSNKIEDNFTFLLDLNEIQCQPVQLTNTSQQSTIDVLPSTNAITIAFQDEEALTSTRYPLSKFVIRDNIENNLTRYYIRYEGQVPQPDFNGNYDVIVSKKDSLLDIYNRSKLYDGSYFHDSVETLEEFRNRGMYIYHPFPKTASSRNTVVYVQTEFSDFLGLQPFLLVFSHSKKAVILKVMNGKIVEVSPYDV